MAAVRQSAFGDADAVSPTDRGTAELVGHRLAGRTLREQEVMAYLEPWRPHRFRVLRLLAQV